METGQELQAFRLRGFRDPRLNTVYAAREDSGAITCLTLLVQHMFYSNVANNVANSSNRIRQIMPYKIHMRPY